MKERRQGQSCLFRKRDYRYKHQNPEKTVLIPTSAKDGFCRWVTKADRWTTQRTKQFLSKRKLQQSNATIPENSWVRFSVKMISASRYLRTIRERCQDQSCLLRRRHYRNKERNPERKSCVPYPVSMASVARNLSTTEHVAKTKVVSKGDHRNKGHKADNVLGSSPDEDSFWIPQTNAIVKWIVSANKLQKLRSETRKNPGLESR